MLSKSWAGDNGQRWRCSVLGRKRSVLAPEDTGEESPRARTDLRGQSGRRGGTTGGARTGSNWSRPRRDSEHGRCDNLPVAFPSHQAITAGARPTPSKHQKPSLPREPILRFFFSDYWKPRSRGCLVGVGDKREGTDRRPSHCDHAGSKPSRLEGVRSTPGPMAQEFSRAERAASWYVRCHAVRNEVRCGQAARRPFPRVGLAPFTCARTRDQPAPASHAGPSEGPPAGAELTWKERPSLRSQFFSLKEYA